jgi:diguanylate cyclase (GGDEF)-like protein
MMQHALPPADVTLDDLRERIRLLEAVIDNFPGGIMLFDKDLNLVVCNEQQKELLQYPDELFAGGHPALEQIFRFNASRGEYGPGDIEAHVQKRMDLAREQRAHVVERTRPNGTVLQIRGVPLQGGGFVTTYLDVSEQRRDQAMIAHLAHHDPLTDLPNRALLLDRLEQALARVRRGETVALLYLDLDHFKPVNDRFGHAVGDALLQQVAARLRAATRETDTVARIGGDEFVTLQSGVRQVADINLLARRLVVSLAMPYAIAGHTIEIGASVGIAVSPSDALDADQLIQMADCALYRSKSEGRGRYCFFEADAAAQKVFPALAAAG